MENEKKRSGWRTAGLIAGVGCLSIIVVIVGGVVIATMYARATLANLGDPDPKPVERRIALPSPATNTTKKPGAAGADRSALRLTLDLREGDFTIQPGEPGNDVQVRGEFAPGLYELVETQDTDDATGVRRATVRFRSKAPAWARMFAGFGGGDNVRPHLTVIIPRGAPIDLNLQLRINTSMGNLALENLGNAHADTIHASGSMGNVTANLSGSWPAGATSSVTFEQSMGELTLRVPNSVRLDADVRSSQGGETKSRTTQDAAPPNAPNAPTLRLRVNSSMGEARVVRY
jgi:hypothetical protein